MILLVSAPVTTALQFICIELAQSLDQFIGRSEVE